MTDEKKTELEQLIAHIKAATAAKSVTHLQVAQAINLLLELLTEVEDGFDLTDYALKSWVKGEIPTYLTLYAQRTWVSSQLVQYLRSSDAAQLYAKKKEIPAIPDLTPYATLVRVSQMIQSAVADLASKEEIPSVAGLATQAAVDALISSLQRSVNDKVSKAALADYAKKTDIPSLTGYAKVSDIPSLAGYARKTDIPATDGFATKLELSDYMPMAEANEFHDDIEKRVRSCEEKTKHLGVVPYNHGSADSLVNTAKYYVSDDVQNVPSLPCYIEVMGFDANFVVQRAIERDGTIRQRVFNVGQWSEWRTL